MLFCVFIYRVVLYVSVVCFVFSVGVFFSFSLCVFVVSLCCVFVSDSPSQVSQVGVVIQVLDVNDNPPTLAEVYKPHVCDNAQPGQVCSACIQLKIALLIHKKVPCVNNINNYKPYMCKKVLVMNEFIKQVLVNKQIQLKESTTK